MTTYEFEGNTIVAASPAQLVHLMHTMSWSQSTDDQDYMRSIADRLVVQSSLDVRHDTADHFVEDLIKYGILTVQ